MKRSRLAVAAGFCGGLGLFLAAAGPLLIWAGAISPIFGFARFYVLGMLIGAAALPLSLGALHSTRRAAARGGRRLAWLGCGAGALLLALLLHGMAAARGVPAINDITTNPADPPALAASADGAEAPPYPAAFADAQRSAYPDIAPLHSALPANRALARAEAIARKLGWQNVRVLRAESGGVLHARQVSAVFRFVDDVAVRVRPHNGGAQPGGAQSQLDLRSRSRVGRSDLGANAARIRAFVREFQSSLRSEDSGESRSARLSRLAEFSADQRMASPASARSASRNFATARDKRGSRR